MSIIMEELLVMQDKISIHCFVSGRVQGVYFRNSTQKQAISLSLTGWVRNVADGRVEVMAFGEREKLLQLYEWLHQGPLLAKVNHVSYEELPWCDYSRFEIT
jgi:acylphosphatase